MVRNEFTLSLRIDNENLSVKKKTNRWPVDTGQVKYLLSIFSVFLLKISLLFAKSRDLIAGTNL